MRNRRKGVKPFYVEIEEGKMEKEYLKEKGAL